MENGPAARRAISVHQESGGSIVLRKCRDRELLNGIFFLESQLEDGSWPVKLALVRFSKRMAGCSRVVETAS